MALLSYSLIKKKAKNIIIIAIIKKNHEVTFNKYRLTTTLITRSWLKRYNITTI